MRCRLFTVGRLDVNSTGLIFVTNDGDWAQQVMHPSSNINKEYVVTTETDFSQEDLETIARGGVVEGEEDVRGWWAPPGADACSPAPSEILLWHRSACRAHLRPAAVAAGGTQQPHEDRGAGGSQSRDPPPLRTGWTRGARRMHTSMQMHEECASVPYPKTPLQVKSLRRVRVGGFRLPRDLEVGQFRELKPSEVKRVTNLGAQQLETEAPVDLV